MRCYATTIPEAPSNGSIEMMFARLLTVCTDELTNGMCVFAARAGKQQVQEGTFGQSAGSVTIYLLGYVLTILLFI